MVRSLVKSRSPTTKKLSSLSIDMSSKLTAMLESSLLVWK
ncbi:hypothetical protein COO91_04175 [Nostoc flagelliforme CCNUN1]|uniref:Uncharacterized protein n=1 Tax=Nostoc flagelliforme CCNUN1 TaxID=2038116 RepID=A0A2K8SS92_9NOSO|nr:hypothetical protein COO91_04175 [Nostoc flagelliforme CCNUN1]